MGIGGQGVGLRDGKIWPGSSGAPDFVQHSISRTAIAVDPFRKILFLAVGENISPRWILQELC